MLLDVIFPVDCLSCDAPARGGLCAACADEIPTLLRPIAPPPGVATAWILGGYDGPLGAWIRQGKYRSDPAAFVAMGARLARASAGRLPRRPTPFSTGRIEGIQSLPFATVGAAT